MNLEMAKEWLKSSSFDLENISYIIEVEHLTGVVAFHAQQAIEKSLKAYLAYNEIDIPKTHKLQNLLGKVDIEFEVDDNILQLMDKLYIDSRYPGDLGLLPYGQPTLEDAKEFYESAQTVFEKICRVIGVDRKNVL